MISNNSIASSNLDFFLTFEKQTCRISIDYSAKDINVSPTKRRLHELQNENLLLRLSEYDGKFSVRHKRKDKFLIEVWWNERNISIIYYDPDIKIKCISVSDLKSFIFHHKRIKTKSQSQSLFDVDLNILV